MWLTNIKLMSFNVFVMFISFRTYEIILTSSRSQEDGEIPAINFHTRGAKGKARGFLVLIAIPNKIPKIKNHIC